MADDLPPIAERFSLDTIIAGLASDLDQLRAGTISTRHAKVRAEIAREIMRGVDLALRGQKFLEQAARQIPATGDTR